jgi:hypothetical protein
MTHITFIQALSQKKRYKKEDLLTSETLISSENNINVYYAPFETINKDAKIIFVGITPGWQQMEIAFRNVKNELENGKNWDAALAIAKMKASFAGQMRKNLINYLDQLGLHEKLQLDSAAELFEPRNSHLIHSTSMLRYPVMIGNDNYRGNNPSPHKSELLWNFISESFVTEINNFKGKLIVPLGSSVKDVIKRLTEKDMLNNNLILENFPHPSGLNGHRHKQFATFRDSMTAEIKKWEL